jgi:uncharacterized protein with NRDE domain
MCLILFAWNSHPEYSLVVAANRDEFYERPTHPIGYWNDAPHILGSRDAADVLGIPGTALGLSMQGKFAAVTNIRAPSEKNPEMRTRGELTAKFLTHANSTQDFIAQNEKSFLQYNGFNLLLGDISLGEKSHLSWLSNRLLVGGKIRHRKVMNPVPVNPGVYGLSNAMLDTPWPKVRSGVASFAQALAMDTGKLNHPEHYFRLLKNDNRPGDDELPSTGVNIEWERALSPIFIKTENYGTRSSSLLRIRKDGTFQMIERTYDALSNEETSIFEGQFSQSTQTNSN